MHGCVFKQKSTWRFSSISLIHNFGSTRLIPSIEGHPLHKLLQLMIRHRTQQRQQQQQQLQSTSAEEAKVPHHSRGSISRRSTFSKHSNRSQESGSSYSYSDSNLNHLKGLLKPEWEVDYLDELADDSTDIENDGMKALMNKLIDNYLPGDYQTLQELRYLDTLREDLDIDEQIFGRFNNYSQIIKSSRVFLKPLFDYISKFERNLKALSMEMEFLQNRSNTLNSEIKDKKSIDLKLTPIINDLIIPPETMKSIFNDPIDFGWQENLRFLSEKSEIFDKYSKSSNDLKFISKLKDLLHLMELKAVERIRDFLILKIKLLRKNNVSSQVVQKSLLVVKEIFSFLKLKNEKLANELKQAYCFTIKWYYHQNFVKYLYSLEKLRLKAPDKNIILGNLIDEEFKSSSYFFSTSSSSSHFGSKRSNVSTNSSSTPGSSTISSNVSISEYLMLNKREEIITSIDQSVMLGQIAETNQQFHWLEEGFKDFNQALLDNVSTEYLFLSEFFLLNKFDEINDVFKLVFQPTFQLGVDYTKFLIESSPYDSYAVLICIRLCQKMEYELQHRRIPVMEDYLNLQLINLWPKFQSLIDLHCYGITKILSYSNSMINSNSNLVPLPITQQFALFLSGLLKLSVGTVYEIETSEPLTNSIIRLRNVFETVLTKLSGNINNYKKKEMFLYNNYFLISTILNEIDGSQLAKEEQRHFQALQDTYKQ